MQEGRKAEWLSGNSIGVHTKSRRDEGNDAAGKAAQTSWLCVRIRMPLEGSGQGPFCVFVPSATE